MCEGDTKFHSVILVRQTNACTCSNSEKSIQSIEPIAKRLFWKGLVEVPVAEQT